jgi:ubiquitin fusion degradation protein 1
LNDALRRFTTITVGDIIQIYHRNKSYDVEIETVRPCSDSKSILIVDTDLEVDLNESERFGGIKEDIPSEISSKEEIEEEEEEHKPFRPFSGIGYKLGGINGSEIVQGIPKDNYAERTEQERAISRNSEKNFVPFGGKGYRLSDTT